MLTFALVCVAQSPDPAKEAYLLDSFGAISNGDTRGRLDTCLGEIASRRDDTRGIVVNYGTALQVKTRNQRFKDQFTFRGFDMSLINYVVGGNVSDLRTDLWIVPPGASPRIDPEAFVGVEVGRVTKAKAKAVIWKFSEDLAHFRDHKGYIFVYGTERGMTMQERWLLGTLTTATQTLIQPR